MTEYGECRPVGDKDAGASSPEGGKDSIAFSQTDSGCYHEKPPLVARQCTFRCIKPPNIAPHVLSCQNSLGITETIQHGFNQQEMCEQRHVTEILIDNDCFKEFTGGTTAHKVSIKM